MTVDVAEALSQRIAECPGYQLEIKLMQLSSLVLALQRARASKDKHAIASALLELSRFGRSIALAAPVELYAEYSVALRRFAGREMDHLGEVEAFYERWLPNRLGAYYQPEREELDRLLRARSRLPSNA